MNMLLRVMVYVIYTLYKKLSIGSVAVSYWVLVKFAIGHKLLEVMDF